MMQVAAHGRLGQDPRIIDTKSGNAMTVCSLAVTLPTRDEDDATQWFDIVAFGRVAELLAKQQKGELVSVSGRVQMNRYQPSGGETRETLQIIVDSIVSARSVRPGGRSRTRAGKDSAAASAEHDDGAPFDDALPEF